MRDIDMKAAIITIFDKTNYGNRLQNYAVQYVLGKMKLETITYAYEPQKITNMQKVKHCLQKVTGYCLPGSVSYWKYYFSKLLRFEKFNNKRLNYKYIKSIDEIAKEIDYFVLGSDQVWNPLWYDSVKRDLYLLTFTERCKKVCFSPSFGLRELPEEWNAWFKKYLLDFEYLSVRENAGAKIIENLTGQEAEVLIDPTLMLTKEEWMKIAYPQKKVNYDEEYIFIYFLGGISDVGKNDINLLEKKYGYKIVDVLDMDKLEYMSDPGEFIYLIAHAKMILTDSFHGCVFSFLFDKLFWVYDRVGGGDMNSRIDTFLGKFHLESMKREQTEAFRIFEIDYSASKEILCAEKEKVIAFLNKSIHRSLA